MTTLSIDVAPIDEDRLVELVARYILARATPHGWEDGEGDGDNRIAVRVEKRIVDRVDELAAEETRAVVVEIAREKLERAVAESIDAGWPITNQYGEPTGQRRTLATFVREHLSYDKRSRIDKMVAEAIEKALAAEFSAVIKAAGEKLRAQIDGVLQAKLNETMRKALGLS